MPLPDLTRDEQFIRSYYLATDFSIIRALVGESIYIGPAILIAFLSLTNDYHGMLAAGVTPHVR